MEYRGNSETIYKYTNIFSAEVSIPDSKERAEAKCALQPYEPAAVHHVHDTLRTATEWEVVPAWCA
jgi:hypothetical protein